MKKLIPAVLTLLFLQTATFAQDCKYKTKNVDKFTKTARIELEPVELCSSVKVGSAKVKNLEMILKSEEGKKIFTLAFSLSAMSGGNEGPLFIGNSGNKIILLLDNSEKVELEMIGLLPDVKGSGRFIHFDLPEDKYLILSEHSITDVRALPTMNPFDFVVNKEVKTSRYFLCLK